MLKETWAKNIENGTRRMPNMPITFGFRDGEKFWFAERKKAFWFPTPTDKGPKEESVLYEANRIDPEVKFTREACKQLTGIPKPFIRTRSRESSSRPGSAALPRSTANSSRCSTRNAADSLNAAGRVARR